MSEHGADERLSLPLAAWPAAWRKLWVEAMSLGAEFDEDGPGAHLAPDTKRELRKRLEQFAGFLSRQGPLSATPGAALTSGPINAYAAELRRRRLRPTTVAGYLRDVREAVRLMEPAADLRFIRAAVRRLSIRARKAPPLDRAFVEPIALYRAGLARMIRVAVQAYEKADVKAVQFGDGLLMAVAACTRDRLKNLSSIGLGRNLAFGEPRYILQFEPHETKGRKHHVSELPSRLSPFIDEYLAVHRAQLLQDRSSDILFISCYRGPLSRQSMYIRFRSATLQELGVELTPHDVRGAAVTDLVEKHPELVDMAPDLLHHSSSRTTHAHYIRARQIVAQRRYLEVYEAARQDALDALDRDELFGAAGG